MSNGLFVYDTALLPHRLRQPGAPRHRELAVDADQRCASARELASGQRNDGWVFTDENCATLERLVMIEWITHQPAQRDMQGLTGPCGCAQQLGKR